MGNDRTTIRRLLAVAPLLLALSGCADARGEPLQRWSLVSSPGSPTVELPDTLPTPGRGEEFVLERTWTPPAHESPRSLDLVLQGVQAPATLYVDGERAQVLRDGAGIAPPGRRRVVPQRFRIPPRESPGPRTLQLRIDNSWYQARWVEGVPRITNTGALTHHENVALVSNLYLSWVSVGVAVQVGVMFLAVFLFGGGRTAYMWFGIQALCSTALPWYLLGYTQALFGDWEGGVFGALLAICNTVGVRFSHEFFGLKPPPWWLWLVTLLGMAIPMAWAGPFQFTPYGAPPVNLLITLHVGYQILLCARLWRARGPDLRVALFGISWLTLATVSTPDQLAWAGIASTLEGARLGGLGIAIFAFLQSILVASHYRGSLDESDALNQQLQERLHDLQQRKAEVEMLNTELRAQVQDRSQQMFLALSLAASRAAAPVLNPGQWVHGRYEVIGRLGSGGMGDVYRVKRKRDGRELALKVTHDVDGVSLARLAREATMIAHVAHRHIVELVDVDVAPEGFAYLTMEIVEGTPLSNFDTESRSKPWCLEMLDQVLDGLSALHELGIVHRDLKPANVVVSEVEGSGRPNVKLIDFGIARGPTESPTLASPSDRGRPANSQFDSLPDDTITLDPHPRSRSSYLTKEGLLAGTPVYMAPELAEASACASPASDVFAFGVMVYQLLTGHFPFEKPLIHSALHGDELPAPAPLQLPWMDSSLRAAIEATLSTAPDARPTTAQLRQLLAESRSRRISLVS